MSRNKDLQDLTIRMAISGSEDPECLGIQIEDDYLKREKEENKREAGYPVVTEVLGRTDVEASFWKSDKDMEACHTERWKKAEELEEAHLEKEFDEDRMEIVPSKRIVKI